MVALLLVLGAPFALRAAADAPGVARIGNLVLAQTNREIGPNEAAALVQARTGKRVLGVKTRRSDGRYLHLVKVLSKDGRVRVVPVDARTGAILQ